MRVTHQWRLIDATAAGASSMGSSSSSSSVSLPLRRVLSSLSSSSGSSSCLRPTRCKTPPLFPVALPTNRRIATSSPSKRVRAFNPAVLAVGNVDCRCYSSSSSPSSSSSDDAAGGSRDDKNKGERGDDGQLVPKDKGDAALTESAAAAAEAASAIIPIDFDTSSLITGEESQILEVQLSPGQLLRAESGAMLYMTQGIQMETSMGSTGSMLSTGFKRLLTGQNLMISDYTYHGEEGTVGTVGLGTDFPSKIVRLNLDEYDHKIVCQKGAYMAGSHTVQIEMEFAKKFTTGFFGGEGFVLQALMGTGDVFVKAGGTLVKRVLKEGETLRVSSGCLVAFTKDVNFDVQMMPGFKNVLFGGEGLFITTLTGPGIVWMQGLPPDRMISEIARRIPSGGGIGLGVPIGAGGGGGAEGEGEGEGEAGAEGGTAEEAVGATDAAVEADRNATVASSGLGGTYDEDNVDGRPVDSDSPEALFGDAAPKDSGPSSSSSLESKPYGDEDTMGGFEDTTTFSTENETDFGEDVTRDQFDDFAEDNTTFTKYEEQEPGPSDDFASGDNAGDESAGPSILSQLWDFFTGGDD